MLHIIINLRCFSLSVLCAILIQPLVAKKVHLLPLPFYFCLSISVARPSSQSCHGFTFHRVTSQDGFLSSLTADETQCGSLSHPWLLEISEGQTVKVTLLDFTAGNKSNNHKDRTCNTFGYISEPDIGTNTSICGGVAKEREILTSSSSRVQIQITPVQARGGAAQFLLKYEGNGLNLAMHICNKMLDLY